MDGALAIKNHTAACLQCTNDFTGSASWTGDVTVVVVNRKYFFHSFTEDTGHVRVCDLSIKARLEPRPGGFDFPKFSAVLAFLAFLAQLVEPLPLE